jgi:hypothetical protein
MKKNVSPTKWAGSDVLDLRADLERARRRLGFRFFYKYFYNYIYLKKLENMFILPL